MALGLNLIRGLGQASRALNQHKAYVYMAMMWRPYLFTNKPKGEEKQESSKKRPKTRLSVNINKIALLRNARGGNLPNLYRFAEDCEAFGAHGITVHPRPDQRHIRYDDLQPLKDLVKTEFNVEGYPSADFIKMMLEVKPHQCTLVPDAPDALTSNQGWDTIKQQGFLQEVVGSLREAGIRVSLFVDANAEMVEGAKSTGAERVELYTGPYAENFIDDPEQAIRPYIEAALAAEAFELGLNAGHDLNLDNLAYFRANIPNLLEVSIGHALVSDALYLGLEATIKAYLGCLKSKKA